jgi:PIN domain nuclease of toxin-antitoxin system
VHDPGTYGEQQKAHPRHHEPIAEVIIAQATTEGLVVVTRDPVFRDYGVRA